MLNNSKIFQHDLVLSWKIVQTHKSFFIYNLLTTTFIQYSRKDLTFQHNSHESEQPRAGFSFLKNINYWTYLKHANDWNDNDWECDLQSEVYFWSSLTTLIAIDCLMLRQVPDFKTCLWFVPQTGTPTIITKLCKLYSDLFAKPPWPCFDLPDYPDTMYHISIYIIFCWGLELLKILKSKFWLKYFQELTSGSNLSILIG